MQKISRNAGKCTKSVTNKIVKIIARMENGKIKKFLASANKKHITVHYVYCVVFMVLCKNIYAEKSALESLCRAES